MTWAPEKLRMITFEPPATEQESLSAQVAKRLAGYEAQLQSWEKHAKDARTVDMTLDQIPTICRLQGAIRELKAMANICGVLRPGGGAF